MGSLPTAQTRRIWGGGRWRDGGRAGAGLGAGTVGVDGGPGRDGAPHAAVIEWRPALSPRRTTRARMVHARASRARLCCVSSSALLCLDRRPLRALSAGRSHRQRAHRAVTPARRVARRPTHRARDTGGRGGGHARTGTSTSHVSRERERAVACGGGWGDFGFTGGAAERYFESGDKLVRSHPHGHATMPGMPRTPQPRWSLHAAHNTHRQTRLEGLRGSGPHRSQCRQQASSTTMDPILGAREGCRARPCRAGSRCDESGNFSQSMT